ncbi:hypothetical protein ACU6T4_09120 [Avibacterium paragallinarum]|uniref:Uncharacterized protein n=1 Tax=Avibacterium paragallinarum TaxID=728 RepID=A0A0F5EU84_AVIPA|nr:hypothetical protein [Avibacterium paragallinarum]KAA6208761.1 hypothetical protein F1968_07560 [Avibacterium paragallinarum]KKB02238.1 hypothetical protein Z012_02120 [Avibacterium paragallinarum]QIR10868.1 hypothetical protein HBL79_00515 [Avibacterium paragallinarum]QJE10279.1 hypothetical protein HHJ62_08270 [Avibacterium paragallinarum]QJE12473.1 hypothetical protein HHJ61_08280 [Avibacterium paragallinarum]
MINQSGRFRSSLFRKTVTVFIANEDETDFTEEMRVAIVIPASANDLQRLPEGERYLPTLKIFTQEPLKCGDLVLFRHFKYRITSATDWGDYGYYHYFATRLSATTQGHSTGFTIT